MFSYVIFTILLIGLNYGAICEGLSHTNLDFSSWNKVLHDSVLVNRVDPNSGIGLNIFNYSNLLGNADYEKFKCQVENAVVANFTEPQFKAFWINVYNYMAVSIVYENRCNYDMFGTCGALTSIRQIGQQQPGILPTQTWNFPWLTMKNNGTPLVLSLNDVEHGQLRCPPGDWPEDVRIHAAIVCASVSCPNIQNKAYEVATIDDDLDAAMIDFTHNNKKGVDVINDQLWVTQIFSFFPEDFDNTTKPLKTCNGIVKHTNSYNVTWLLEQYAPAQIALWIRSNPSKLKLHYFNYDWDLNGNLEGVCQTHRPCFAWWEAVLILLVIFVFIVFVIFLIKRAHRKDYYVIVNQQ